MWSKNLCFGTNWWNCIINLHVVCEKHKGIILEKNLNHINSIYNHNTRILTRSSHNIYQFWINFNGTGLELLLVAQNQYFSPLTALINFRPKSSCLFSNSWIKSVWAPRLPSKPLMERNNQEHFSWLFFHCMCFFFSLLFS